MPATTFAAIVPTTTDGLVDWNAVSALPASKREAVLTALTGINPETTADRHDVTVVVDMNDPAMGALVSERAYSAGADASLIHTPSLRSVLADAAHEVPSVDAALVLTALMHRDVWTTARTREASPRVKVATLAREVTGSDDSTALRRVRAALADVIDHLAGAIADAAESADAPSRRVIAARLALAVSGDTPMREVPVVAVGGRGSSEGLLSISDRSTRGERRTARETARAADANRFPGREVPTAPAEAPVDVTPLPFDVAAAWLTEATARAMADRFRSMRAVVDRDAGRERSARAATGNGTREVKQTRTARTATAARVPVVAAPTGRDRLAALRRR